MTNHMQHRHEWVPTLSRRLLARSAGLVRTVVPERHFEALSDAARSAVNTMSNRIEGVRLAVTGLEDAQVNRKRAVLLGSRYSLVGRKGLEASYDAVAHAHRIGLTGSIVECGVARGGSALTMALAARDLGMSNHIWLFDSFEGLPAPTEKDFDDAGRTGSHIRPLPKGSCLGTLDDVTTLLFDDHNLSKTQITLCRGWFDETVPRHREEVSSIAVLRLDGDWYESVRTCLVNLFPAVEVGGTVIIDDYYSCVGACRAVDEYFAERGRLPELIPDGRGGCWFVRDP